MAGVSSATTGCIPCKSNRELLPSLLFKSKNIGITLPFNHVNYTRKPITSTRFLIRSSTSDQSEPSSSSSTNAMEEGELGDDPNPVMEVPKGSPSLISALNVEKALRGIAITDADHYGRLGLSIGCSYEQVRVAYKNKVDELSTQGLDDEEEYNKRLELLKESYTILSTEEERRLYDWSLARSEKPDRYVWPFEVDITQAPKGTPPPPHMTGPRGGRSNARRGHNPKRSSTSTDIPTSTQPTRPFIVAGPPQLPEGFQYTTTYPFQPNMFPPVQYHFQTHETQFNNSIIPNTTIPQTATQPPNSHSEPQATVIRAESSSSQVSSQASNTSKVYVEPEGDGFFPNPTKVAHSITDIFKSKFDEPWPNWKKVPKNIRDLWFGEFKRRYWWHPEHNNTIRKNFEKKGAARLKNILSYAREKHMKPKWMNEEVWKGLCNYWDTPEFKAKAERSKRNRASDCGGLGPSLHTAGSIPFTEVRRRLAKILGREPTIEELFLFTHKKKSSGEISGDKWVDKRSEDAYEKFKKKKDDLKLTENSTDAPGSTVEGTEGDGIGVKEQPSQAIDEVEIWRESVGLTKKGKVYGLGLHASTLRESSSGSKKSIDTSRQRSVPVVDTPEFKAAVAEVTSKLEVVQKASEHKDKELQRLKRENKRLKQKVDILFEKLNMVPLQGSESEDDEDE